MAASCDFTVVSGHHPVYDAGEYQDTKWLGSNLLPILNRNNIDLYISGHEHLSQVLLKNPDRRTTFLISGATGDIRGKKPRGHKLRRFIDSRNVAILRFKIFKDKLFPST